MKYRKVLYPLILGVISLQYCISVPVQSIPRSAQKGMGVNAATWTGKYQLKYSTCYGDVTEHHVYTARQVDLSVRPGNQTDLHLIYTQVRDSTVQVESDSIWAGDDVYQYSFTALAVSPYFEKALSDRLRLYLQLHWMFIYSTYRWRNQVYSSDEEGNFGFGMDWETGMAFGENPEFSFGIGALRPLIFSLVYRFPPSRMWALSAHLGYWNGGGPFVAAGVALTPPKSSHPSK